MIEYWCPPIFRVVHPCNYYADVFKLLNIIHYLHASSVRVIKGNIDMTFYECVLQIKLSIIVNIDV